MTAHWALGLIGLPWEMGATGPSAFDCWGLVRHVQREQFGREMPAVTIGSEEASNWAAIRSMVNRSDLGWHVVKDAKAGDVVTMKGVAGPHVGVVIEVGRHLKVLHSVGAPKQKNNMGVVATPLNALSAMGYSRVEIWRANS